LTKGGVDTVDQLCATYDVSRNWRRWPLTVFYALLNVAGINAQVIFASNIETQMKRWQFLKSLAMDLMKEHRGERTACSHFSRELLTKLSDGSHLQQENQRGNVEKFKVVVPFAPAQKLGIQFICARNVKSSYVCNMWLLFVKNVCVCAWNRNKWLRTQITHNNLLILSIHESLEFRV
jgi:hypothetical protein